LEGRATANADGRADGVLVVAQDLELTGPHLIGIRNRKATGRDRQHMDEPVRGLFGILELRRGLVGRGARGLHRDGLAFTKPVGDSAFWGGIHLGCFRRWLLGLLKTKAHNQGEAKKKTEQDSRTHISYPSRGKDDTKMPDEDGDTSGGTFRSAHAM